MKLKSKGIFNIVCFVLLLVVTFFPLILLPKVINIGFNLDSFFWLLGLCLMFYMDYFQFMLMKIRNYSIELTDNSISCCFLLKKIKLYVEIDKMYWITLKLKSGEVLNILKIVYKDKSNMIFCLNDLSESEKDYVINTLQSKSGKEFISKDGGLIF